MKYFLKFCNVLHRDGFLIMTEDKPLSLHDGRADPGRFLHHKPAEDLVEKVGNPVLIHELRFRFLLDLAKEKGDLSVGSI
ncbi:MAG: hypothetical protein Q4B85_08185 [Lachnospiraceae bacterium]|nr:hypothetical protein [Lachnospiraceae bacterium]